MAFEFNTNTSFSVFTQTNILYNTHFKLINDLILIQKGSPYESKGMLAACAHLRKCFCFR